MKEEDKTNYSVYFTEEFDNCLDHIQDFYSKQGKEVLEWWFTKEDRIIDKIHQILSDFPYIGKKVNSGEFKNFRCLTYGKSKHKMLNYLIFYKVYEERKVIDVINILPSRSNRRRV